MAEETTIDDDLLDLTLETAGDGELERQFQQRLGEAYALLRGHESLEPNSGRKFSSKLKLEVGIEFDAHEGTWSHWIRVDHPTRPKPVKVTGKAYARGGGLKIWPEPHQAELPQ